MNRIDEIKETMDLGTVVFNKEVFVSDPCYEPDTWCTVKMKNMKPGEYKSEVDFVDLGSWGTRVAALRVFHKEYPSVYPEHLVNGEAGVDSGQCGFWDMKKYRAIKKNSATAESFYDRVCALTLGEKQSGVDEIGVVSSTGFGDGGYDVFAGFNDKDECVSLEVRFIPDDEIEVWLSDDDDDGE